MIRAKWITYARVAPIRGQWGKYVDGKYTLYVKLSIFLPDWRPNYAIGHHLLVTTDKTEYRIYNPQKLKFSFNVFMSGVKTQLNTWGEVYQGYELVDSYNGK